MGKDLFSLVRSLGSTQLNNIVENLAKESAVDEGRTVIDYKLFDRQLINYGITSISSGVITAKTGTFVMPQLITCFNRQADGKTLQGLQLENNIARISNLSQDGKADEPYRFDRLAIDVEVMDCTPKSGGSAGLEYAGGVSEESAMVYRQIMNSGKLTLNVNNRDLNFAEPIGFAGSSIAIDSTDVKNIYNKKTPKLIDPAIFLPETTSFNAKIEMVQPVEIPAYMSVAITVSLIGYKFLKNA